MSIVSMATLVFTTGYLMLVFVVLFSLGDVWWKSGHASRGEQFTERIDNRPHNLAIRFTDCILRLCQLSTLSTWWNS